MARPTIVFDLDGTLVDSAPDLAAATNHVLTRHGRRAVSLEEVREMVGQGARKLITRGFERTGDALDPARLEPLYAEFIDYYTAHIADLTRPFDGVTALLDLCVERSIPMAVCTNKLESLSVRLLEELRLSHYFGAIVGPDTIGIAKPDPRPLQAAVECAGGRQDLAVMIGDSGTDIRTAQAASIPVVAVTFGYTDQPVTAFDPDHVVDHFDSVWPWIADRFGLPA